MKWLPVLLFAVLCARPASAQATDTAACPAPADSLRAAIRVDAQVRAQTLRVDAPGSARATVRPCTPAGAVRVERQNLPRPVQPGVTYRDVGVRVRITADPVLACRLAAALAADSARVRDTGCAPPGP